MRKFLSLLTICLGLGAASLYAQEICANGIDDDLDGFIDCFDGECATSSICAGGYVGNDLNCEAKPSKFPEFSLELESASENRTAVNLGRVVVGDIDRDGTPEMVTVNTFTKKIFILNGENVNKVNTIQKQQAVTFTPKYEDLLIGNVDNDNCAEIFVLGLDTEGWKVFAFDCNLIQLWSTAKMPGDPGMMGLADFNGDGKVELYARNAIFNAHTGATIVAPGSSWSGSNGGPVAVDILNDVTKSAHLLTDAVKDDNLELVVGNNIYSVNITAGTIKSEKTMPSSYGQKTVADATSIADYNNDGSLDVIASGRWNSKTPAVDNSTDLDNTTIYFWDVKNNTVKTFSDAMPDVFTVQKCPDPVDGQYYLNGWGNGTGRVNIADIDGDGKLNAVYVSGKFLYALTEDLKLKWRKVVNEETSGNTGCTLFDFNGDGQSEIVYRDEKYIYIINGKDGSASTPMRCVSRTNREYPVVADVDGDGNTELCVTCRTVDFIQNGTITDPADPKYSAKDHAEFCTNADMEKGQVRVFRSGGEPWVPARRVWNQHGYFNVNVNDDLTIPRIQQKHHVVFSKNICTVGENRPLNSFLNQSPFLNSRGCPKYASPDLSYVDNSLSVNSPTCPDGKFTVSFKLTNKGNLPLSGTVPISFYNGNPTAAGAVKLNTTTVVLSGFKVNDVAPIDNITVNGPGSGFTLYIVLNDDGSTVPTPIVMPNTDFVECDYANNILSSVIKPRPVAVTGVKVQDNLKCSPGTTSNNGAVRAFVLNGTVENSTDYNFYWFAGNVAKPVASADFTGAIWTGRGAGTYTVYGIHKTAGCSSDTAQVIVNESTRVVNADILLVHAYDHCTPANGALRVILNDADGDGIGENPNNFTYTWYEGNDIFTAPLIGINDTLSERGPLSFTVLVKDKITGCQTIESFTIPDQTVIPVVTVITTEATCLNPSSGSVSASVNGITAGYTFKWYKGASPKPTADFTGSSYDNRAVGKYTVVAIANATNCTSAPVTADVVQSSTPVVTATVISDQTSCDPLQPTGAASAEVASSTTGYTFEWYKGQNTISSNLVASTSTATGLTNAVYTVKAINILTGCFDTEEVIIDFAVVSPTLTISGSLNPTQCTTPNGSISVGVSLDSPADYTFSWYLGNVVKATADFADIDATLSGVEPGQYTVKAINNKRHCDASPVTITLINAAPAVMFTQTSIVRPSTCNESNGSLGVSVNAPGNTLGFEFEWRRGQAPFAEPAMTTVVNTSSTTAITSLSTGIYTLITKNLDNGCTSTATFNLPFEDAQFVSLVSQNDITSCVPGTDGDITIKLTKTPSYLESDYRIDVYLGANDLGPTGAIFTSINPINGTTDYTLPSPLQPGSYTFVAVTTNPARSTFSCRSVPVTAELLISTQPIVFTGNTPIHNINCSSTMGTGQLSVSLVGPTSNPLEYNFEWYEGSDATAPLLGTGTSGIEAGINGEIVQNLPAGKYTVVVSRISGSSAGCTATATYQIFDDLPVITLALADITITDISRCDMMNGGSVSVNFVKENGAQFPASNYDYAWFSNGPTGPQVLAGETLSTLNNLAAGKYYVKPTNKTSNCSTGELIEINIMDKTSNTVEVNLLSFVAPTECLKPSNVTGEFEVLASGTSASGYSYNWFAGQTTSDPALAGAQVSGPNGEFANNLTTGFYTIEVINNTTQCRITDTYELPVDKKDVTLATSTTSLTVCIVAPKDGTVFAAVTSGSKNDYTYNWYAETVKATADFTSTANTPVSDLAPGHYIIIATDNMAATCFVSDTLTVHDERMQPIATAIPLAPLTICDPARPDGAASVSVDGDFLNYTFDWYAGGAPSGPSFYEGPQAANLSASTFSIIATSVTTGCSDTTNVTVEMNKGTVPLPAIDILSMVTSCVEGNGSLTASVDGNTSDFIFDWYVGSQQKTTPDFTGEIYTDLSIGTYAVSAMSRATGCLSAVVTKDIIEQLIYPEFTWTTVKALCKRDASEISTGIAAAFVTNDVNIGSIEWNVNGAIVTGQILDGVDAGVYPLTVTSTLGCSTTRDVQIKTDIRPYNGISRNNDGQNDLFFINCIESFPSNSVKIFNRAGTLVYEAEGYDNTGVYFDGQSNKGISLMGNNLPGGTYFFIVDKHDGSKPIAGYLELVN